MNIKELLKNLAPGLLPLFVFIAAESFFDVVTAIIIAVSFGLLEMVWKFYRERVVDWFVAADIGLIMLLGGVSIVLDNPVFFKIKPGIIELLLTLIMAVSAFSGNNIILLMTRRYMKGVELGKEQEQKLIKSLRVLTVVFFIHTLMIFYSALYMSSEAWGFISGGLFYILFAVYFLYELIKKRIDSRKMQEQYGDEEWLDIVTPDGKIVGKAPRSLCHSGPGRLHPVVHLHVIDSKNRVFLQKRPEFKQVQPGKWDTAVGGHISSGEPVEEALTRETYEEIGLSKFKPEFICSYVWETEIESELVFVFWCRESGGGIAINRDEVEDGKFWKIKKIRENLGKEVFTPNFEKEFQILLDKVL